jgi:hypothetical protein
VCAMLVCFQTDLTSRTVPSIPHRVMLTVGKACSSAAVDPAEIKK